MSGIWMLLKIRIKNLIFKSSFSVVINTCPKLGPEVYVAARKKIIPSTTWRLGPLYLAPSGNGPEVDVSKKVQNQI